jgi:hypothetical protein
MSWAGYMFKMLVKYLADLNFMARMNESKVSHRADGPNVVPQQASQESHTILF